MGHRFQLPVAAMAGAALCALTPRAVGQTIVWTDIDARRIQGKNVNGGEVETLVQFQSPQAAYKLDYDPVTAKLYYHFFDVGGSVLQRANLDGSEPENIPTSSAGNFALNVKLRKLYWIVGFGDVGFYRSELDGSGVESHSYPSCCVLILEAVGDNLFLGTSGNFGGKGVWGADADGSNERFLHPSGQPFDLAHDPVENKLYLATGDEIYRMNLDGSAFQGIVSTRADYIVVDPTARKVYWAVPRVIRRSNLDGSSVEDFVTAGDAGNPDLDIRGLTFVDSDPVTGACCDVDPFGGCTDDAMQTECECASCVWHRFRTCDEIECPPNTIPTVSGWGMVNLTLLLLTGAKVRSVSA